MHAMDVETLIVGAGPAGAMAALALAEHAPERRPGILVVEAACHPRPKPCGGVISARALPILERWVGRLEGVPQQVVRYAEAHHRGRVLRHPLPLPALAVERSAFDAALVDAARERGCTVLQSTRLCGLVPRAGGWTARLAGVEGELMVRARVVLGADGAFGPVRRLAGRPGGGRRARLALVDCPVRPADPPPDTLVFELAPRLHHHGYYWSFPAPRAGGEPLRNRGVFHHGRRPPARPRVMLERRLAEDGATPCGPVRSAVQRLYEPGLGNATYGLLLCGEAVGADPITGEGIAHAVLEGELAARVIAEALDRGALGFADWDARLLEREARVLRQHAWLAPLAYGPLQRIWTERIMEAPTLTAAALRRFSGQRLSGGQRLATLGKLLIR